MRGLYRRGNIYWISYQAGAQTVRESTGTNDRKLAEGVLAKRRADVFEGRLEGQGARSEDSLAPSRSRVPGLVRKTPQDFLGAKTNGYCGGSRAIQAPTFPSKTLTAEAIEQFLLKLLAGGLSKARVNRYTASP